MDPFIETNPELALELAIITKKEYDAIVNPSEEVVESAPAEETAEETVTINGKSYTKAELKKLLE
jgi:hypothetical protein